MCFIFLQEEEDIDAENMEEDVDGEMADIENLNYDDLDSVSKLQKTQRYVDIMQVNPYLACASILTMACTMHVYFMLQSLFSTCLFPSFYYFSLI